MSRTLSTQEIAEGLRQAGFPEQIIPTMTAVTMAESGGDPYAYNPRGRDNSYGLTQVNMRGPLGPERRQWFGLSSNDQLFDPATNFRAAKAIYDRQGLGAWGAYTNGSYKKFLGRDYAGGESTFLPAGTPQVRPRTLELPANAEIPRPTPLNDDLVGLAPANAAAVAGLRALAPMGQTPMAQPSAPEPRRTNALERMAATSVASIFAPALEMSRQGNTGQGQPQPLAGERMGGFSPIEYLTGDPDHPGYRADHAGANYHEHIAFRTIAERDAAMAKLRAHGIEIGSVNDGKHSPNSYHYADLAFDVPAHQVPIGQEQALSRRVRAILGF